MENNIIPLSYYLSSAGNCTTPQFDAQVIGTPYVSVTVQIIIWFLVQLQQFLIPPSTSAVTGVIPQWIGIPKSFGFHENWLQNGDLQSDATSYWVFQNGVNPLNPNMTVNWLPVVDTQSGVLQLTQWGDSSIKIIQNVNNNPNAGNPFISIHGGSWYTLRAKFKTDNINANRRISLQMHGYSGYGQDTLMVGVGLINVPVTASWQEYEVSFYARTNLAAVVIVSNTNDSVTSSLYIDDIQLIEKEPDSNNAYGNTSIPLINNDFTNDLSGWGFQGVYRLCNRRILLG